MANILDDLYHSFYKPREFTELKNSIEENHKILIEHLTKEDKILVLRIIDAEEMICNYQSKESFIQGLKFGIELKTELQNYKSNIDENERNNDSGQSFMPKCEDET